jgi:hypothetical protein
LVSRVRPLPTRGRRCDSRRRGGDGEAVVNILRSLAGSRNIIRHCAACNYQQTGPALTVHEIECYDRAPQLIPSEHWFLYVQERFGELRL